MNLLMAGMVPTVMALRMQIASGTDPLTPAFWFVMSIALLVGFVAAYPMNWWLVANRLKHGMMTVRPAGRVDTMRDHDNKAGAHYAPHDRRWSPGPEPGGDRQTGRRGPRT